MQTSIVFPIMLKDLRANRWIFVAYFALVAIVAFVSPPPACGAVSGLANLGFSLLWSLTLLWGGCLIVPRVVLADAPTSDTAFWATRPIARSTLFLSKALLIAGACVLVPALLSVVAQMAAGLPPRAVLLSLPGALETSASWYFFLFALCSMTKKLGHFLLGQMVALVLWGFLMLVAFWVGLAAFFHGIGWAELAAIYLRMVTDENLSGVSWRSGFLGVVGWLLIAFSQYITRRTLHTVCLSTGLALVICVLTLRDVQQLFFGLPVDATTAAVNVPADALQTALRDLYPAPMEIETESDVVKVDRNPTMCGQCILSNWPSAVNSIAVSDVTGTLRLGGRDQTVRFVPAGTEVFEYGLPVLGVMPAPMPAFRKKYGFWRLRNRSEVTKEPFPILFAWPPEGFPKEGALSVGTNEFTMSVEYILTQLEDRAVLPLQAGATASFGNRLVTILSVTPSPRGKSVKVEMEARRINDVYRLGLAQPVYRLKIGAPGDDMRAPVAEKIGKNSFVANVVREKVSLTFQLDQDVVAERVAGECLARAEIVVSENRVLGKITRNVDVSKEAMMRVFHATNPRSHRPDHAELVLEDAGKVPADRRAMVAIGFYLQMVDRGGAVSLPKLRVYVPSSMRADFQALPDDAARYTWLATQVRAQMDAGDQPSADGYATLLLHGIGVERDLPRAKALLADAITRNVFGSARKYVQLCLLDPDQPQGVHDALDLLIPMLDAGHLPVLQWATDSLKILAASPGEADRAAESRLALATGRAVLRAFLDAPSNYARFQEDIETAGKQALDRLFAMGSAENLALADELVAAWLIRDPQNSTALEYRRNLGQL